MKFCVIARTLGPSCPAASVVRGLVDLGHEVHVVLAPIGGGGGAGEAIGPGRAIVHRLDDDRPAWLRRLPGRIGSGLARRAALGRLLRSIGPQVVHVADDADPGIPAPPGSIVLRSVAGVSAPSDADAAVLPDGRFLDRAGLPVAAPGAPPPPIPSGVAVAEGLDPAASASDWRLLTYLASVEQLRRDRRLRLDRPHRAYPTPTLAIRRALLSRHPAASGRS